MNEEPKDTKTPAPGAVASGEMFCCTPRELWILSRALESEADRISRQAAEWRTESLLRRTDGMNWQEYLKTAIRAEGNARRIYARVSEARRIYAQMQQNAVAPAPRSVSFVIQRPNDFAEWFAGWNACGPIWTGSFADAYEVRAELLVSYMLDLAKHKPCASLSPNVELSDSRPL